METGSTRKEGDRMPRTTRPTVLAAAALAGLALALVGCGGSSSPGVAHLSSDKGASSASPQGGGSSPESSVSTQQKMVAFAKCMRANGVPDFPEPVEGHLQVEPRVLGLIGHRPPHFESARKACGKLLPYGGEPSPQVQAQAQEQAVKFSACIRAHGMPNFADPEFLGNAVKLDGNKTFEPNSPQFKAAAKICLGHSGGPKAE